MTCIEKIIEYADLPDGWDSYNGKAIPRDVIIGALELLQVVNVRLRDAVSVVPGSNGTIQFEWEINDRYLELEVIDRNRVAWVAQFGSNITQDETTQSDKDKIAALIDWLETGDELGKAIYGERE